MDKIILLNEIIRNSGIHPSRVFNVTIFGSRVYGTSNSNSDWDVIMIANNSVESTEIRRGLYNIHVYTPDKFRADLDWHRINNLECIYAPDWARLKETIDFSQFKVDKVKLRHSISHISSNSWVKCKKKLNQNDYQIGVKSIFHSMRIPMFGIQIAKTGRINDFTCANFIWNKIKSKRWTWVELDKEFRELRNEIMTEFRKNTEK